MGGRGASSGMKSATLSYPLKVPEDRKYYDSNKTIKASDEIKSLNVFGEVSGNISQSDINDSKKMFNMNLELRKRKADSAKYDLDKQKRDIKDIETDANLFDVQKSRMTKPLKAKLGVMTRTYQKRQALYNEQKEEFDKFLKVVGQNK